MSTNHRPDQPAGMIEDQHDNQRSRSSHPEMAGSVVPRSFEGGHYFRIHNALFHSGYSKVLGPYALALYAALASCANARTQQAYPSIATLQRMTGMSRTKVIESSKELEAWGMIRVEARSGTKGTISNLYTLTDPSTWRHEVELMSRKGELVRKSVDVIARQAERQEPDPSTIPTKPVRRDDQVRRGDPFSVPDEPAPVRHVKDGGVPGGYKQHSGIKTNPEENIPPSTRVPQVLHDGGSNTGIDSDLAMRQEKALELLRRVAPDFTAPQGFVNNLDSETLDFLGRIVCHFDLYKDKHKRLRNPAGYIRSELRKGRASDLWDELANYDQWFDGDALKASGIRGDRIDWNSLFP